MLDNQITVVVPTSPIPSHPDTRIIDEVLASIRFHLPESKIIVTADGVRPQVEHRREQYAEYKKVLAEKMRCLKYGWLVEFDRYTQQAEMLRQVIERGDVQTPYVLFVEHDTPLVTTKNPRDGRTDTMPQDCQIDWQGMVEVLHDGKANQIRFYVWEAIFQPHAHMMRGEFRHRDATYVKTTQYSQWPNLATTDFYRRILPQHFRPQVPQMIELGMYGPVANAPWEQFKVVIYLPDENARRFYHLNGRADENGVRDEVDW